MLSIRHILCLSLLFLVVPFSTAQDGQSPQALCDAAEPAALTSMQFQAPDEVLEAGLDYRAIFCTSAGAIYVDLYESLTPTTVNNFVFLAQEGYYDSTSFHRVIPGFMAQGGDPTATGRGGPGYQFGDEPIGFLTFDRPGLLAMANAGPGTNGGQFFITTVPTPHLNFRHTIFGDVLLGQSNVEAIRERDPATAADAGETLHTVLIISDPSVVDNTEVVDLVKADEREVSATFELFSGSLPAAVVWIADESGAFTTMDIAESTPDKLREAFDAYAEAYGHQYRYSMQLSNPDCDSSVFFTRLGFTIDVFENGQAAAAALEDNLTRRLLEERGFQHDGFTAANYAKTAPACDGGDGSHVMSLYTRGRFLVTIETVAPSAVLDQVPAASLLINLALQIEGALADIFRGEIR